MDMSMYQKLSQISGCAYQFIRSNKYMSMFKRRAKTSPFEGEIE